MTSHSRALIRRSRQDLYAKNHGVHSISSRKSPTHRVRANQPSKNLNADLSFFSPIPIRMPISLLGYLFMLLRRGCGTLILRFKICCRWGLGGSVVSTRLCLGYSMGVVWCHCFRCLCKVICLFIVYFWFSLQFGGLGVLVRSRVQVVSRVFLLDWNVLVAEAGRYLLLYLIGTVSSWWN